MKRIWPELKDFSQKLLIISGVAGLGSVDTTTVSWYNIFEFSVFIALTMGALDWRYKRK